MASEPVLFNRSGLMLGMQLCLPIALSVFTYGLLFGVLARQAGLHVLETLLMSSFVLSGSAQFVALELWRMPLPVGTLIFTTLVLNLRHVLMGMALRPWFAQLSPRAAYTSLFFMADENWALAMRHFAQGGRHAAVLLGSGLLLFVAWVGASCSGHLLGGSIPDPSRWGVDFAFTAVLLALLIGLFKQKSDIVPWVVAAGVAIIAAWWLPGKWYVLIGGLAGSVAGAMQHAD